MLTYWCRRHVLCSGTFIPSACMGVFQYVLVRLFLRHVWGCFNFCMFVSIHMCGLAGMFNWVCSLFRNGVVFGHINLLVSSPYLMFQQIYSNYIFGHLWISGMFISIHICGFAGMFKWACSLFRNDTVFWHVNLLVLSPSWMFRLISSFGMFGHVWISGMIIFFSYLRPCWHVELGMFSLPAWYCLPACQFIPTACLGIFEFLTCLFLFRFVALLACLIGHVVSSGMLTYWCHRHVWYFGAFIPSACLGMFDFLACLSAVISMHICGQVLLIVFVVATTGRAEVLWSSAVQRRRGNALKLLACKLWSCWSIVLAVAQPGIADNNCSMHGKSKTELSDYLIAALVALAQRGKKRPGQRNSPLVTFAILLWWASPKVERGHRSRHCRGQFRHHYCFVKLWLCKNLLMVRGCTTSCVTLCGTEQASCVESIMIFVSFGRGGPNILSACFFPVTNAARCWSWLWALPQGGSNCA